MFKNYLVTALRNLIRHRLYSFINIAGLAVGLTCAILIVLFVRDELSWDRWLPGSEKLYRLTTTLNYPGRDPQHFAITAFPLLQNVKDQVPEVLGATHMIPEDVTIGVGQNRFYETAQAVDTDFFQVIRLPFAEGSPDGIFTQPDLAVLSQSSAKKYFGTTEPLGKIITVSGTICQAPKGVCTAYTHSLTVRGVIRDLPNNSQLEANILFPTTSAAAALTPRVKTNWLFLSGFSYILLAPGSNAADVTRQINDAIDRSFDVRKIANLKMRASDFERIRLTQFWNVHLSDEKFSFDMRQAGDRETVYGLSMVAVLILLVAAFNYTNLAIAQSALRAKEIALRKCVGARRREIALQFLGESVLLAFLSLVLALSVVETILPLYGNLLARQFRISYLDDWQLLLSLVAVAGIIGVISGAYPALILSKIRPAMGLRHNSHWGKAGAFRTGLIAMQFAVSIGLGIVTITVFSQNNFERKLDLGFHHDNVIVAETGSGLTGAGRDSFMQALASLPSVEGVAASTTGPFANAVIANTHVRVPGSTHDFIVTPMSASPEYPALYNMHLVAGRFLSRHRELDYFSAPGNAANDGHNILVNQSAARLFGFDADHAIGRSVILSDSSHVNIVGVLGDAQVDGAARSVAPTIYFDDANAATDVSVKIRTGEALETVASINKAWKAIAPQSALQIRFLNQDFQTQFQDLQRRGLIFGIFSAIVIAVASLGLFGVAAFSVERQTREIGVRKVFGATVADIVRMLMRQFSTPVFIASLIAWPLAYLYLHHWLQQYPHRVPLDAEYFIAATCAALLISSGTVFVHARRVANANPIYALRYE